MDDLTQHAVRAAHGDEVAIEAFVRCAQTEVWRLCAALGGRDHADDLTQETFLRALRSLPRYRADASARTWLLTIARNTCADHVRRSVRRGRLVARLTQAAATDPVVHEGPALAHDLDSAVGSLEPDRRAAFVLTQVLGLGYAEAADVCGCPVGTIRSRVARAREDLVRAMDSDIEVEVHSDRTDRGPGAASGAGEG